MSDALTKKTAEHADLLTRYQRAAARAQTLDNLHREATTERDEMMAAIGVVYAEIVALRDAPSDSQDC
jgi:hypothetical protein